MEFFDIRDAAKALKHMNGKEIHGKQVAVEFSEGSKFLQPASSTFSMTTFRPLITTTTTTNSSQCFSKPELSSKKSIVTEGSHHKREYGGSNNQVAMGEQVRNGIQERHSPKRNFVKKQSSEYAVESTKRQQPGRGRHYWRGKQVKNHETRFLIKEDATVESCCLDSRTTVMIKNIPNKYRFVY